MWPFKKKGLSGVIDGIDWDRRLAIINEEPIATFSWAAYHIVSPEFHTKFFNKELSEDEFKTFLIATVRHCQERLASGENKSYQNKRLYEVLKVTTYESIFPLIDRYNSR